MSKSLQSTTPILRVLPFRICPSSVREALKEALHPFLIAIVDLLKLAHMTLCKEVCEADERNLNIVL